MNDFDLGLKVCQTIWLLYKWGADGLLRFSSPCTLLILLMMFAEMDSALISAGLDGLDNLARWLFKSIIRGNEDTARRVKTREKVFIHYCHTHTRTHTYPEDRASTAGSAALAGVYFVRCLWWWTVQQTIHRSGAELFKLSTSAQKYEDGFASTEIRPAYSHSRCRGSCSRKL